MLHKLRAGVGYISHGLAAFAAHPLVQIGVLAGCVVWLVLGGTENALASGLTIGGFVLTQMVLNEQRRREKALHLKLDELIVAMGGARNEVLGAEDAAEHEIERLRAERPDDVEAR